jgi:hypothetical protein
VVRGASDTAVLKEAGLFAGGRYGISIDSGLEVVERKNACGLTSISKFHRSDQEVQREGLSPREMRTDLLYTSNP